MSAPATTKLFIEATRQLVSDSGASLPEEVLQLLVEKGIRAIEAEFEVVQEVVKHLIMELPAKGD